MKKRITAFLLTVFILVSATVTAFAATPKFLFESSFDSDTGLLSVTLYIKDALGLESGDLALAFDNTKLSFVDSEDLNIGGIVVSGLSSLEADVCTCSFMFVDKCEKENLDENGNLALATYRFKPLTEDYGDDDFCFWPQSLHLNSKDICKSVKAAGNKKLSENRGGGIRVDNGKADENDKANAVGGNNNQTAGLNSSVSKVGSNWYVYVIAVALAIGAIVGIALVAVKGGQKADNANNSDSENNEESDADTDDEKAESED